MLVQDWLGADNELGISIWERKYRNGNESFDEDTEKKVMQGICALEPRPTCLLVTHRKSVLNYCDREIVISNKSVTEEAV